MYKDEGLDVTTDGKPWQWAVATVVSALVLVAVAPIAIVLAAAGSMQGRRRR